MAEAPQASTELEQRLWDEIEKARFGMLGLVAGPPSHFQPMTAFCDRDARRVWFYSHRSSDLARSAGAGHPAMLCVMATDQEFQACIAGRLVEDHDRARIDYYWSAHVSAWFPGGKDDPDLTLLRLDASDARVWVSRRGPFHYGWQIAKANLTRSEPDVGAAVDLKLG
jgi:general stress protein 26